eukprot:3328421-Rhodomonas_salina.2
MYPSSATPAIVPTHSPQGRVMSLLLRDRMGTARGVCRSTWVWCVCWASKRVGCVCWASNTRDRLTARRVRRSSAAAAHARGEQPVDDRGQKVADQVPQLWP